MCLLFAIRRLTQSKDILIIPIMGVRKFRNMNQGFNIILNHVAETTVDKSQWVFYAPANMRLNGVNANNKLRPTSHVREIGE